MRDQYDLTIPLDAPPGEYQIEVGMGERLKVIGEEEYALDDRILLERIEVGGSDFITMEEGNGKSDKERIWEAEFARGQDGSIRPVFDKFSGAIL